MMDEKTLKCCPNCCQLYNINLQPTKSKSNLPLFLKCGHSMCENCIKNIVKFLEPIECKVCHKDMKLEDFEMALLNMKNVDFYHIFPVNFQMLGELTLEFYKIAESKKQNYNDGKEKDCYINIGSILMGGDNKKDCMECHQITTKICQQCSTYICENCFIKTHKNFVIFKNHVLQDIELLPVSTCTAHENKPIDYYCNDCKKSICMDCFMLGGDKSCKTHAVVSMQDMNAKFYEEINSVAPNVDETFRRLSKTAVDIGNLLTNLENQHGPLSELDQIIANIEQHFSKLCSIVQKHKQEIIDIVMKLKSTEKQSLYNAKDQVEDSIKKAKHVMDTLKITSDPKKFKKINVAVLLEDAKKILEAPWCLKRDETDKNPLKVSVNEDLCGLVSDYIHLEGNASSVYKLFSTTELGDDVQIPPPPPSVVFPPELPKDVRQSMAKEKPTPKEELLCTPSFFKSAPQYRNKSNSVASLNSNNSETSQRSYLQSEGDSGPVIQHVKPFVENQKSDTFQEGSQELVYISHIVDPHNLYVQRASHQSLVKDMLRQLRNAVSLPTPSPNHITEGKLLLAFNKPDNMWQRCRIMDIDRKLPEHKYHVFFIDFGSSAVVGIKGLRLLPPVNALTPGLAIKCALANCQPKNGAWTSEDAILMQSIIDNKQAVIHVREVRRELLLCDITTFADGISLAHALVFHERAKMPNPRLKYSTSVGVKDKVKIFMNEDGYKPKSVEEVYITHIISPDKFFVRKKHQQAMYEKLSLELAQEYSFGQTEHVYLPEVGMAVGVQTAAGAWERGVVAEVAGRGRARVRRVDTGAELLAHWAALRQLRPRHATLSAGATECHLAGVTPLNKRWKPGAVALLHQFVDKYLELHVEENRHSGSVGVVLYDCNDEDNIVCINELMIKHKFAISFGIFTFNRPVEEQVQTHNNPLDKPPQRPKQDPKIQILKKSTQAEIKNRDLDAKDKGPLRLEAKVLNYQSPSLIYVSLAHQQKVFHELSENMQVYYSKLGPVNNKIEWKVGDMCSTVCIKSQTWRRAVIIELKVSEAKVFYSDFAYVETVPINGLRELPPEFASIGEAAVKCHLYGVTPAVGDEWPSITKEFLKELIDAYKRIFITKVGDFKDKSMPIEIWVYHTIQGGALEPNISEWRCLNKKIIEQGLAIPDKAQQAPEPVKPAEGEEEMLSFLNVKGAVSDWLQLEPVALESQPIAPDTGNQLSTSTPIEEVDEASKVMLVSDWLPPEPIQNKEFIGMPTYIDDDGVIYLHDIQQQDTLDLIQKGLDVRFKNPDPKAKYVKWRVGEPCIALFFLDNHYYRGRVVEVNNEQATCTVHYIDYGNNEQCSFLNMRKSIVLHQIPTQAQRCILDRIRPVGAQWDRLTLDYIHKSIVEKKCNIKIIGEPVEGVIPIELRYDKLCINDHMVEFEMAQYTDGSKPIVHRFAPLNTSDIDSDPDYIVEEEDKTSTREESFDTAFRTKNWNEMMEEDDVESTEHSFVTYTKLADDQFKCKISLINKCDTTLELNIVHEDDTTDLIYEEMSKDIQMTAKSQPPLKGIFEHKPCVALFKEDQQWYRASILEYSEIKRRVKVKYVDYGNIEIVSLDDVREIHPDWAKIAPANVTAKLHGISINTSVDANVLVQEYTDTFLDKDPFNAIVIKNCGIIEVELKNDNGELVYQDLIEKGIFVKCSS